MFAVKAVCDNDSRKRKRCRDDPGYSIMRSEDGSMSFQASKRRAERGRGGQYPFALLMNYLTCLWMVPVQQHL